MAEAEAQSAGARSAAEDSRNSALPSRRRKKSWPRSSRPIDAVLARSSANLEGVTVERPPRPETTPERDSLVHDPHWDEHARLEEWRALLNRTMDLPPVLTAAILWDAWGGQPAAASIWLSFLVRLTSSPRPR
ncbi:DUF1612 domain-containing protein [Sinorhizobium numidicum]